LRLIIGLGNPGRRYEGTWHNLGARVVIALANTWNVKFRPGRGDFVYAENIFRTGKVGLMIPTLYMNRSGSPVSAWLRYYKLNPAEALIIYDDHDMMLGRIRIRENGSSGGHRGMADIIRLVGTEDIPRIRIGIRTDSESNNLSYQVLSKIPQACANRVNRIIETVEEAVVMILDEGITAAMNRYNGLEIDIDGNGSI